MTSIRAATMPTAALLALPNGCRSSDSIATACTEMARAFQEMQAIAADPYLD